jgi:hypothetical protein
MSAPRIVTAGVLDIGVDRPGKAARVEAVLHAPNRERRVMVGSRIVEGQITAGGLIARDQRAEAPSPKRPGQLGAEDWIDDTPGVDGGVHVAVAAADAGDVEESCTLHEEGALLREEHREALIHLHLEGVALDLAEIGIDRRVEGDRRRQPELPAEAELAPPIESLPVARGTARLLARVGRARNHFANRSRLQMVEHERRVMLEDPLVGREVGP